MTQVMAVVQRDGAGYPQIELPRSSKKQRRAALSRQASREKPAKAHGQKHPLKTGDRLSEQAAFNDLNAVAAEAVDGRIYLAVRGMAKRWGWPTTAVTRFLLRLQDCGVMRREIAPRHIEHTKFAMILTGKTMALSAHVSPRRPQTDQAKTAVVTRRKIKKIKDDIDRALLLITSGEHVAAVRVMEKVSNSI